MTKRWGFLGSPLILLLEGELGVWQAQDWEQSRHGGKIWPQETVVDQSPGRNVVRDLEGWVQG